MILTIAIENTNTVIGCFKDSKMLFVEQISTSVSRTELEYVVCLKSIFELHGLITDKIEGTIISSVVPPITNVVKRAVKRISGKEIFVIGPGVKTGLNIMMEQPAQVGSDLVAMAVAGITRYELPLIIINMGTATTFSVIDEKKHYIGGMILPGVGISAEALAKETAQLPKISLEKPKKVIGSNTIECMKSGLLYGTAACIDGCIARIEHEMKRKAVSVIITGETAEYIVPFCQKDLIFDGNLLLRGLYEIYIKNSFH